MPKRRRGTRVAEATEPFRASRVSRRSATRGPGGRMIPGVRFLVDEDGRKTAVVIDLRENLELWEDFYDRALARQREGDPRESLDQVKARLRRVRRGQARG